MYILFLDIDGVIATGWNSKLSAPYKTYRFDMKAVKYLNKVFEELPELKCVISSDWKDSVNYKDVDLSGLNMLDVLKEIFEFNGFKFCDRIIDITPSYYEEPKKGNPLYNFYHDPRYNLESNRALEILEWVKEHKPEKWVAIDDLDLSIGLADENFQYCARPYEGIKQSGLKDKLIKKFK